MKFEEKLMTLRKAKGWSQEDLSHQIGVSRQTISKWESSQTTPEMNKLIELSKIFEISVDELINDVKEETNEEEKEEKVYTKINLKPTNVLVIIACVLTIIGLMFSIVLYQKSQKEVYVDDIVMISYSMKMQENIDIIEIYSFNNDNECIGTKKYVQASNSKDYEQWIKDISESKDEYDLRHNIILNSDENEIIWSERKYENKSKEKIVEERKTSLINCSNLKITDM